EEFFFRGVLQTRFENLFGNKFLAVVAASILFGLYHLPYAYLNPRWPSFGNWSDAFASAMGQGVPAGLIFGTVYARTRNLLVPVIVHSLINTLPAMTMMKFGEQ
ncbi:MAG: CPBP family intramembrane glutamic endopeptidase, partial [Acidobacteriota bacterium]